jgi:hypothetical protein
VLVDVATDEAKNVTAVDRVSLHNSGLFFWPGEPSRLGFQAIIDGNSHPFSMDWGGRKRDLTEGSREFAYGLQASPDGRGIAYYNRYKMCVADADGLNSREIATDRPFNFAPQRSPDGAHLLFLADEHYDRHSHVVLADGNDLRQLADRAGYHRIGLRPGRWRRETISDARLGRSVRDRRLRRR